MDEQRQYPRQRTFKTGSITLPVGTIECLIRNMAEKGALLEFLQPPLLPDDFDLIVKPDITRRKCHVIWRKGRRVGVQFV